MNASHAAAGVGKTLFVTASGRRRCTGACHCGAVRFDATLDFAAGSRKCNCSHCSKTRFWKAFGDGRDFELRDALGLLREYRFGEARVAHCFCGRCGTQLFARAETPADLYAVNVACLDDAAIAQLAVLVRYEDGRNDNWWEAPGETTHL